MQHGPPACQGVGQDHEEPTVLTSIDYAKAFNRLSFQHCLKAFAAKGASTPILRLLATFLMNRTMTVRVGRSWSDPLPVTGCCPQGSIWGVFLFKVTTDDLEEELDYVTNQDDEEDVAGSDSNSSLASVPFLSAEESQEEEWHEALEPVDTFNSTAIVDDSAPSSPEMSPITIGHNFDNGLRRPRCVVYSSEEDKTPPPEPTRTCLGRWIPSRLDVDKYVDDNLQEDRVSFENVEETMIDGRPHRTKHAIASQNVFRHIVRRAEAKGMKVNTQKTNLLCISDSQNHSTAAFILDAAGSRIESCPSMKMLGFHFSSRPNMDAHVAVLKRRFRERYWVLVHLKNNGFSNPELVEVYKANIRPVAEYLAKVYHSSLTDRQDEEIERLQSHALRCIFGARISVRRLREMAGLKTLRARQIQICDKFADKCVVSERFSHWFPLNERRRATRGGGELYREDFARCDRLYNSTLFYLRRRKNGKEGKNYGERNSEYRE